MEHSRKLEFDLLRLLPPSDEENAAIKAKREFHARCHQLREDFGFMVETVASLKQANKQPSYCRYDKDEFSYVKLAKMKYLYPEAITTKILPITNMETSCTVEHLMVELPLDVNSPSGLWIEFHDRVQHFIQTNQEALEVPEFDLPGPWHKKERAVAWSNSRWLDLETALWKLDDLSNWQEIDGGLREEISAALKDVKNAAREGVKNAVKEGVVGALCSLIKNDADQIQRYAARILGIVSQYLGDDIASKIPKHLVMMVRFLKETATYGSLLAISSLLKRNPTIVSAPSSFVAVFEFLEASVRHPQFSVRYASTKALGRLLAHQICTDPSNTNAHKDTIKCIVSAMKDKFSDIRRRALFALDAAAQEDKEVLMVNLELYGPLIAERIKDESETVRTMARDCVMTALDYYGGRGAPNAPAQRYISKSDLDQMFFPFYTQTFESSASSSVRDRSHQLPCLFFVIKVLYKVFRSESSSSLRRSELASKLLNAHMIYDKLFLDMMVCNHYKFLEQTDDVLVSKVPYWITKEPFAGESMYNVKKDVDLKSVIENLNATGLHYPGCSCKRGCLYDCLRTIYHEVRLNTRSAPHLEFPKAILIQKILTDNPYMTNVEIEEHLNVLENKVPNWIWKHRDTYRIRKGLGLNSVIRRFERLKEFQEVSSDDSRDTSDSNDNSHDLKGEYPRVAGLDSTIEEIALSASSSLFTKEELIQKIMAENSNITERVEIENQFDLLVKILPNKYRKVGDLKYGIRRGWIRRSRKNPYFEGYQEAEMRTETRTHWDQMLKEFDMNETYGPCVGMTRLDRWKRAENLQLNPPLKIYDILTSDVYDVSADSMWDARL